MTLKIYLMTRFTIAQILLFCDHGDYGDLHYFKHIKGNNQVNLRSHRVRQD